MQLVGDLGVGRRESGFFFGFLFLLFFSPFYFLAAQEVTEINNPRLSETQQNRDSLGYKKKKLGETEINFLFSYYDQDGIHSPVTGGQGTEELQDYSSIITVSAPLDSSSRLNVLGGINYYSSASTDRIDFNMSSASSHDIRGQFYVSYEKELSEKNASYSLGAGLSSESDYLSASISASWFKSSPDGNRDFSLIGQVFLDRWLLIFPEELRKVPEAIQVETDRRNSYSLTLIYNQVINKRLQLSLISDLAFQNGLLTTPFHRVFFRDRQDPKIERLPGNRVKIPLGLRMHYFLGDFMVLRGFYRWYWDSFGIQAHTINLETPLKLGNTFTISPFYRYHTQSGSRYFAEFQQHDTLSEFYTSDWDLSGFHSHKFGLGIRYSPLYGLSRFKMPGRHKVAMFKSLGLRYANYRREDGLNAFLFSLMLKFLIK